MLGTYDEEGKEDGEELIAQIWMDAYTLNVSVVIAHIC